MTIIVKKSNLKEIAIELKNKMQLKDQAKGLKKHYGKLKRNLDGLAYQNNIRSNED